MSSDPITTEEYFRGTLKVIAHWSEADLSGEWETGLRGVIRSMTDAAKEVLSAHPEGKSPHTFTPAQASILTDEQRDALERMAGHDPNKPGLSYDSLDQLVSSAARAAQDVLTALAAQPPAAPVETEAVADLKYVPAEHYEALERLHHNEVLRSQAAEREIERLTKLAHSRSSAETDEEFEDRLQREDAAANLRLIDFISDKIGLPHNEELSRENFIAWLNRNEPQAVQVTDDMCEAAIRAYYTDRIQGFTYQTHYVIRDVWKEATEQKVWEIDKNDADAEAKFYHQTRIERMRKVLEAACSVTRPHHSGE